MEFYHSDISDLITEGLARCKENGLVVKNMANSNENKLNEDLNGNQNLIYQFNGKNVYNKL